MGFYTDSASLAGGVILHFTSPPQYRLYECTTSRTDFPTALPTGEEKVWTISLTKTSGIRLVIHCNEVEVLNVLLSAATCTESGWENVWDSDVTQIRFGEDDTASDYQRLRGRN